MESYERDYPEDQGGLNASLEAMLAADAGDARRAADLVEVALERGKGYGHFHHTEYTVATVYDTSAGLVYATPLRARSHGSHDLPDSPHSGHEATRWLDGLPWAGRIVELAAGTGWWSPILASRGELWCFDAAPAPQELARDRRSAGAAWTPTPGTRSASPSVTAPGGVWPALRTPTLRNSELIR